MNTLIALAAHDPWLTLMWLMVAVVAISRVAIRRMSRAARYTWWDDDPTHPTGQNSTER